MTLRDLASHAAHLAAEAAIGLAGLAVIAVLALTWRLAQGPIDITGLARRAEARLAGPGTSVRIGAAALAWEGFAAIGKPLDIRVRDAAAVGPDGQILAAVPSAAISLSFGQLLLGRIVPRDIAVEGARLTLLRDTEGRLRLDLGTLDEGAAGKSAPGGGGAVLLRDLSQPASSKGGLSWVSQLRRVRITNADVTVRDAALGVAWSAPRTTIDLARLADGGVRGHADLALTLGHFSGQLTANASLRPGGTEVTASLAPFSPADLAVAAPSLAPLAALAAPLRLDLAASLDAELAPRDATLTARLGAGSLALGTGQMALAGGSATLTATPGKLVLRAAHLDLAAAPGAHAPPPAIDATANLARAAGRLRADFAIQVGDVAFADLPSYWPPHVGGGSRAWITENITGGTAKGGRIAGTLAADADFGNPVLTALSGGVSGQDITLWWLRPIPPITGASATLTVQGPDRLLIRVAGGRQGPLAITDGRMSITGLDVHDQDGAIELGLAGPLADTLALLNHPRLRLLSRRPIPFTDPAGQVTARLSVGLPLEAHVTMDQVKIASHATLTDVHLGGIAAGQSLDAGMLKLAVDQDGLDLSGTGRVAGIDSTLGLQMDFRNGPPDQVLEHATLAGDATPSQLAAAAVPGRDLLTGGHATLRASLDQLRDGTAAVALDADLGAAAVTTPLGWSKAAGEPASLHATLGLRDGKLARIDALSATGPGLRIASHAAVSGGTVATLVLDDVAVGRSAAHGRIDLPTGKYSPVRLTLTGPRLDISAFLKPPPPAEAASAAAPDDRSAPPAPGTPWAIDVKFDQLILAQTRTLAPFQVNAADDGLRITRLDATAGPDGGIRAAILSGASGRHLTVAARDAGAVLVAAGIADNISGGDLSVDAAYDDARYPPPLAGTATLRQFRVRDAPAIGRLLKAMTLYGAIDLMRGPGLGFARMIAPFTWHDRVLTLTNARAFSASLGLTAKGTIDLRRHAADVTGTVVPAYFFNQLLGNIPLVGKLFSPEKGGGVFAARYAVRGPFADPSVSVNPLSALTPGFLRGIFGTSP